MRFNPQETMGSRFRLHYRVDLQYEVAGPAEFLLNVHAARNARQNVINESFELTPGAQATVCEDQVTGNRIATFRGEPDALRVRYAALVEVNHSIVDPAHVCAEIPSELPVSTLCYLYPSRYCQSDLVQQQAWDCFCQLPRGYGQVLAVRDWVRGNVEFRIGASCAQTTAVDTLRDGIGVCRDFAHGMITYCRALNYPARFVTGVDYGADPSLGPPDFHAYVEVFIGGAWYLFDPTGISPETGLIRIGTGRDAADTSFATIFGPVRTFMPHIQFHAVSNPSGGFIAPVRTELAVSTAD